MLVPVEVHVQGRGGEGVPTQYVPDQRRIRWHRASGGIPIPYPLYPTLRRSGPTEADAWSFRLQSIEAAVLKAQNTQQAFNQRHEPGTAVAGSSCSSPTLAGANGRAALGIGAGSAVAAVVSVYAGVDRAQHLPDTVAGCGSGGVGVVVCHIYASLLAIFANVLSLISSEPETDQYEPTSKLVCSFSQTTTFLNADVILLYPF